MSGAVKTVKKGVKSAVGASLAPLEAIGGLIGPDDDAAKAALAAQREALAAMQREPEPTMPTPDDEAVRRARRRSIARQLGARGRQSTILTGGAGDTLG